VISREEAAALDADDPLATLRDEFVIEPDGPIYLDGNSLGRLPRSTEQRLALLVSSGWGHGLVRSWDDWVDLPAAVGDRLGEAFLGAAAGQVLIADSTSVNLYKLASAVLHARPGAIAVDRDEFPSDRYVLQGLAEQHGTELRWFAGDPALGPTVSDLATALAGGGVSLVVLSLVGYRSAAWPDVDAITDAAHDAGALILWDCSHAVGSVPIELDDSGADLAVGCTYKYLNAGPGSPAFLYVRAEHQATLRQPIWGWFGQGDQFAMGQGYAPAAGIRQFGVGSPPIPGVVAVDQGIDVLARAGIDALRAKSTALTSMLIELAEDVLLPCGLTLGSPRDAEHRGGHVSLRRADAEELVARLLEAGVVTDFRAPDSIRLAPVAASTRYVDVWDGVDALRQIASA
jgi:kynureninase